MSYEIKQVQPGEPIRASVINGLIDAVNGDMYSGVGNHRETSRGVVVEENMPLYSPDMKIGTDVWQVDPITLKIHRPWLTVGDKSYGACLMLDEDEDSSSEQEALKSIDIYHQIDFGKETIEKGEYQGDYYLRISNQFISDPDYCEAQEDDADAKRMFDMLYVDNEDPENLMRHYYEIQVVKDVVKNGGETSLEDDHGVDTNDCVYFKFFTIMGPRDGEKDEEGKDAKTLPPYCIKYYQRQFDGISLNSGTTKPWKIRWMQKGEQLDDGEWQIYLPMGCAALNDQDAYYPKNDVGTDKNGNITYQWYKIEDPQDADADLVTSKGYTYKQWTVYAHFMDFPLMKISSKKEDPEFKTTTVMPVGTMLVREWNSKDGKRHVNRSSNQLQDEKYIRWFENEGAFRIYYKCTGNRKEESSYQAMMTNQFIRVGREQIWLDDDTDITQFRDVVLKIDHSKIDMSIEITDTMDINTIDATYIRILRLKDGVITDDMRDQARSEFNFYVN